MKLPAAVVRRVELRAGRRCEYCRMHLSLQGATFHIEHVTPRSRGGASNLENFALACPACNLHKADRLELPDLAGGGHVPVFHPRNDRWVDHFKFRGYRVLGLTAVGRATVEALRMNDARRVRIRRAEKVFDLFPP